MATFDQHWDYANPKATRQIFQNLQPEFAHDVGLSAELQTQIARTHSLVGEFADAHALLDAVELLLTDELACARIRYLLERGRTLRSSGEVEQSIPLFQQAYDQAVAADEDNYAVDAAHMLAIVLPSDEQIEWNLRAMDLAERSQEKRANNWIGSLSNNLGWTYHDRAEYETALSYFERALAFYEAKGEDEWRLVAHWTIGRTYRSLNRIEEALTIQQNVLAERQKLDSPDGYVHEELAECYLLLNQPETARPHFAAAYELLSQDSWLSKNEPERIKRLAQLAQRD